MIFISVLLGLMDFSDIVISRSRPNRCCQQNLKCFDMFYYRQVCFHERVAMTVKLIKGNVRSCFVISQRISTAEGGGGSRKSTD